MRLALNHFLHVLSTPMVQAPSFGAALSSLEIKMLHHDHVRARLDSNVDDERSRLSSDLITDALGARSEPRHLFRSAALSFADSPHRALKTVFFAGKVQEASFQDSAVRTHRYGRCGVIDAKIHGDDHLIVDVGFVECSLFFVREVERPDLASFANGRAKLFSQSAMERNVVNVCLAQSDGDPVPGISNENNPSILRFSAHTKKSTGRAQLRPVQKLTQVSASNVVEERLSFYFTISDSIAGLITRLGFVFEGDGSGTMWAPSPYFARSSST